jgi:rhodanese-related sulfurtransferase
MDVFTISVHARRRLTEEWLHQEVTQSADRLELVARASQSRAIGLRHWILPLASPIGLARRFLASAFFSFDGATASRVSPSAELLHPQPPFIVGSVIHSGISKLPKDKPLVFLCAEGERAAMAAQAMHRQGFTVRNTS